MKTVLLSVSAVLLGLAVGFAVAVVINPNCWGMEKCEVLVAGKDGIGSDATIVKEHLARKSVPRSYVPHSAIDGTNDWLVIGLKAKRRIPEDGYILYSDIDIEPMPQAVKEDEESRSP